jgi:uncharacterized protein (DUF779 family)
VKRLTYNSVDCVNCYDRGLVPPVIFFVSGCCPQGGGAYFYAGVDVAVGHIVMLGVVDVVVGRIFKPVIYGG